jgi:hypothetical protein
VLLVCTVYSVLCSEIALSRKPFGIGHMHIYTFLLRMTDTVTSQNIDFSSWDTLYICALLDNNASNSDCITSDVSATANWKGHEGRE